MRIYIALAVLLVMLAGVIGWQVLRPPEREAAYQGKPLSVWLKSLDMVPSTVSCPRRREPLLCRGLNKPTLNCFRQHGRVVGGVV
jgi:hypothetical protein